MNLIDLLLFFNNCFLHGSLRYCCYNKSVDLHELVEINPETFREYFTGRVLSMKNSMLIDKQLLYLSTIMPILGIMIHDLKPPQHCRFKSSIFETASVEYAACNLLLICTSFKSPDFGQGNQSSTMVSSRLAESFNSH